VNAAAEKIIAQRRKAATTDDAPTTKES